MKSILLLQLLCMVPNSTWSQSGREQEPFRQNILTVLNRQVDGWNEGDIYVFMKGYWKSDSVRFASGGTVTYGWQNMLERYTKRYSTKEKMGKLSFTDITVDSISSNAAIVFGTWTLQREQDKPWGLFTLLLKQKNGEWRIVSDHTSSGN